ncbi:MAG: N-6 DNA methylase [Anaerolineae bacterium]
MAKAKKTDLRDLIRECVRLLKPTFDTLPLTHFVLTLLFVAHIGAGGGGLWSSHGVDYLPLSTVPILSAVWQRRKSPLYDDLLDAFTELEGEPPLLTDATLSLEGAFVSALTQAAIPEPILTESVALVERFSTEASAKQPLFQTDHFGTTFVTALDQLVQLSGRRDTGFYTPRTLARLVVELAKPSPGMSIYDPTVGTAGLLVESARFIRQYGGDPQSLRLNGCELDPRVAAIGRLNLAAHGLWNTAFKVGNTLETPSEPIHDLVVQALPVDADGKTVRREEENFLRHALASLTPQGRAVILSASSLLRNDHRDLWQSILNRDWLETVISLPPMLLHGTSAGAVVLMFNKDKPAAHREQVLFIDAVSDDDSASHHSRLADETFRRVVEALSAWKHIPGFARVVTLDAIRAQGCNLNAVRYMEWTEAADQPTLENALDHYRIAVQKREEAMERLRQALESLNYPVSRTPKP